jgi:hypothetical protein
LESESDSKERWQLLCRQAATEQNPDRFLAIIQELKAELDRRKKLKRQISDGDGSAGGITRKT